MKYKSFYISHIIWSIKYPKYWNSLKAKCLIFNLEHTRRQMKFNYEYHEAKYFYNGIYYGIKWNVAEFPVEYTQHSLVWHWTVSAGTAWCESSLWRHPVSAYDSKRLKHVVRTGFKRDSRSGDTRMGFSFP